MHDLYAQLCAWQLRQQRLRWHLRVHDRRGLPGERRVLEVLTALRGTKTLLVVTHRPALIAPADQILTLEDGGIRTETRHIAPMPPAMLEAISA